MPQNLEELCRLLPNFKEGNNAQRITEALTLSVDNDHEVLKFSLQSIKTHRPIGKVMIVSIGECKTGKSTTLHNLFNDGKSCEISKYQTREVTEYSELIACSHFKAHLSFVDTPGIFEEARNKENMAKITKFRTNHPAFRQICGSTVYPNLVLITVKASDTRLNERDSFFSRALRAINGTNLIDPNRINLIVVATFSAQITTNALKFAKEKERVRYVISKVVHSVLGILSVKIIFIENESIKYNLRRHRNSDFYELPDGEVTPLNLRQAICDHLISSGDVLGWLVTSQYFNENCKERKHELKCEEMSLIFDKLVEDFEKKANMVKERMKALDQKGFCKTYLYAGCGYSLRKECTLTSQISTTPLRLEIANFPKIPFSKMSFKTEGEYKINRLEMYDINSKIELSLGPEVSSFGKWEHDGIVGESKAYKDKIVISFVYHEKLGTITFDDNPSHLVEEFRKVLKFLPSQRCFDGLFGLSRRKIEQFYSFFDKWGTHYIKEVGIGGWMRVDFCVPSSFSDEERKRLESRIEKQISSFSNEQVIQNDLGNIVDDSDVTIKFFGGIPPDVKKLSDLTEHKFTEWKRSLENHPVELENTIKLKSYEVFLDDENKKTCLREAALNYLKGCPVEKVAHRDKGVISQTIAARLRWSALIGGAVIAIMWIIGKRNQSPRINTDTEKAVAEPATKLMFSKC